MEFKNSPADTMTEDTTTKHAATEDTVTGNSMKPANRPIVLIVDDEPLSRDTLRRTLDEEFDVLVAADARSAIQMLSENRVQVVLSDQRMPEVVGVEFLTQVRERWPEVLRLLISGYTDSRDLIEGINKAGIYQFIPKPWHPEHLLLTLRNATCLYQLQQENKLLSMELKLTAPVLENQLNQRRHQLKRSFQCDQIIRTHESPMNAICAQVEQIAPYDIPVLVTGESGTGKELIARAIHYNSLRADKPFVMENCGAMPVQLLESELFGHKKGAFTGAFTDRIGLLEQADGGSVFLDEIGDTSLEFQVKLLRFLQEGEVRPLGSNLRRTVNARIITATNRDLLADVKAGRFREDLYYRLSPMPLHLVPLRERAMDIPLLAQSILEQAMVSYHKDVKGFTDEALACLQAYTWPGNVRELQNEVRRLLVLSTEPYLEANMLSPRVLKGELEDETASLPIASTLDGSLKERVELLEAQILKETLIRNRWNKTRAASELGLSRVGLRSKLERYGLEPH